MNNGQYRKDVFPQDRKKTLKQHVAEDPLQLLPPGCNKKPPEIIPPML